MIKTLEDITGEYSPVPLNLLERRAGLPGAFGRFPSWFNRDARRQLALDLKRSLPLHGSTEDVVLTWLLTPTTRFQSFWAFMRGIKERGFEQALREPYYSLDYFLLDALKPCFAKADVDRASIQTSIANFEAIEAALEGAAGMSGPLFLAPFALWPQVTASLLLWEKLNKDDREKLANAVFALCGISRSEWFFRTALEREPEFAKYFAMKPTADEAESFQSEQATIEELWAQEWARLNSLCKRAGEAKPSVSLIQEFEECVARLVGLRVRVERFEADAQSSDFLHTIEEELARAREKSTTGFPDPEIVRQVCARWAWSKRDAADPKSGQDIAADAARAAIEIRSTAEELERQTRRAEECAVGLAKLEVAIGKASDVAQRRNLLQEQTRLELERARARNAVGDLEQRMVDVASPFKAVFDWSANYADLVDKGDAARSPSRAVPAGGVAPSRQDEDLSPEAQPTTAPAELVRTNDVKLQVNVESPAATGAAETEALLRIAQDDVSGTRTPETASASLPDEEAGGADDELHDFTEAAGILCKPIWRALSAGEAPLAFQLARASALAHPTLLLPPPSLLLAVALANYVQSSHGNIASELEKAYADLDAKAFAGGPQSWSLGLNLLLLAGTLYPALIAPNTGATAVLRYRHLEGVDALHRLCETVIDYGERLQGLNLNLAAFRSVRNLAGWRDEMAALRSDLAQWRDRARGMTILFAPATAVWRKWMTSDGPVSRLLALLESEDSSNMDQVRERIRELEDTGRFQDLVRHWDRRELRRHKGDEIHATALRQLRERALEACERGRSWLELMEARPQQSDYVVRELDELRQRFTALRGTVSREISLLSQRQSDAWQHLAAGARALSDAINAFDILFSPAATIREPEPDAKRLLGAPLLVASGIDLDDSWEPLDPPATVLAQIKALSEAGRNYRLAFGERLKRGDIDGAEKIVAYLDQDGDPKLSELLNRDLRNASEDLRIALRYELAATRGKVEEGLAYGYITEEERAREDGQLVAIEQHFDQIRRFGKERAVLAEIRGRMEAAKQTRIAEARARLEHAIPDTSRPEHGRIRQVLESGDVLTANEYLQLVQARAPLPAEETRARDAFRDFFPDAAQRIDAFLEAGNAGQVPQFLRRSENFAGLDIQALGPVQARTAIEMYEGWLGLRRLERATEEALRRVLVGLGFANVNLARSSDTRGRSEWTLDVDPIADRAVCPVPQYGSQASGKYRLVCVSGKFTVEDLLRWVPEAHGGRPAIVFFTGRLSATQRRDLSRTCREKLRTMLVLDEVLLTFILGEARSRLAAFFQCALPFTFVEPYVTTSGLVPPEMFYGRDVELAAVREPNGRCFIYGGRQLGKTALLRHAERSFTNPRERRFARWVDLRAEGIGLNRSAEEIWLVVHKALRSFNIPAKDFPEPNLGKKGSVDAFIDEIKSWFGEHSERRFLLLLDEADKFLEHDARNTYPETTRLKSIMDATARRFKVVFAGLHNVLRTTEQSNHPLAHLGEPINIGPLIRAGEWRDAKALVSEPVSAAGYEFSGSDLAIRILAQTNYYPSLIQLYGAELLRRLRDKYSAPHEARTGPRYAITDAVIDETYRSRELREAIRSRFHLTLQLDPRYEVIAYSMAYAVRTGEIAFESGASFRALKDDAVSWWPEGFRNMTEWEFRVLLDEMVGLGVLRHASDLGYVLRNPNILLLIGSDAEIESVLLGKPRELPQEFEPNVFRAQLDSGIDAYKRSPLTFGQEGELREKRNGVSVITGIRAAGLADLGMSLSHRVEREYLIPLRASMDERTFERTFEGLDKRTSGGTTVMVVPAEAAWDLKWLNLASARVGRLTASDKFVRVVFVADPSKLRSLFPALEEQSIHRILLKPWTETFLRQWLEEIHVAGADPGTRHAIATETGLWPSVLYLVANRMTGARTESRFLEAAKSVLTDEKVRTDLFEEFGLADDAPRAALKLAVDLGEFTTPEYVEFADPDTRVDPAAARDWLTWANALGLILPAGRDAWRVDPFLARLLA